MLWAGFDLGIKSQLGVSRDGRGSGCEGRASTKVAREVEWPLSGRVMKCRIGIVWLSESGDLTLLWWVERW